MPPALLCQPVGNAAGSIILPRNSNQRGGCKMFSKRKLSTHALAGVLFSICFAVGTIRAQVRSEEHTSELQSRLHLVCRLLLEKKKNDNPTHTPTRAPRDTRTRSHKPHARTRATPRRVVLCAPRPPRRASPSCNRRCDTMGYD